MTLETRAAFAARVGMHKSSITRAVQEGHVVMEGAYVNVEKSLPLIEAMRGNTPHTAARVEALKAQRAAGETKASAAAAPSGPSPARDKMAEAMGKVGARTKVALMRKAEAEADMQEIKRDTERGLLLEADQVTKAWASIITAAKGRLLALPQRLAFELVGIVEPADIERRIRAGITDALEDLARGKHDDSE